MWNSRIACCVYASQPFLIRSTILDIIEHTLIVAIYAHNTMSTLFAEYVAAILENLKIPIFILLDSQKCHCFIQLANDASIIIRNL